MMRFPGMERSLAALTACEREATAILEADPELVPGLLQTADYARAVLMAFEETEGTRTFAQPTGSAGNTCCRDVRRCGFTPLSVSTR
ncbi:MAG TPA: Scr1 family TA system antitoxin-like transcriptional regulator [Amycolatopsis sp.]|uniref:Scr1 family TA system antitoxin-like transcriptional regulator n=1 Tax=Amycolatopsis sp. TaxID=37632 RepID=UPI002B494528|nr:Scr1 family TA system antitoxin-like transcriptional regulator [Amycolatopsis sp.]HKS47426.1 Scr1 family TA system antitoxin-like transcriptional regulator [Amycolatopsis sp.]